MTRRSGSDDRTTWRQFLRYRFDVLLARGTWAVLLWLGIVTFAVVLTASLLLRRAGVSLAGSEDAGWFEDFWQSLLRTLDTGTMAGDDGWRQRLVALGVTIFGLLVLGTLIGVIATGVEAQIDRMKPVGAPSSRASTSWCWGPPLSCPVWWNSCCSPTRASTLQSS